MNLRRWRVAIAVLTVPAGAAILSCTVAAGAQVTAAAPPATPAARAAPPAASASVPAAATPAVTAAAESNVAVLTGDQVIQILDETVDWYRTLGTQQQNAHQPSDLLILFANRQTADQVVGLAFDIARANAELLSSEASAGQTAADASSPQALTRQEEQLAAQRAAIVQEMGQHQRQDAKLPELQGELAMLDARRNLLDTMTEFVAESDPRGAGANALKAQIDAIAATVPTGNTVPVTGVLPAAGAGTAGNRAAPTATSAATAAEDGATPTRLGIWDLGGNVLKLQSKISTIDDIDRHTALLADTFKNISRAPLQQLKAFSGESDALARQADNADGAALKNLRGEFDTLAWLFKQTSAILVPLTKEQVLLQQYRHNLANWRDATRRQLHDAWGALGLGLGILAGMLAAVFALAAVWRHAVLKYAHDARRRYQLLLMRKIIVWSIIVGIVGLSFVTELSALATFAGLITAGIAVAMQSVLVSVVGYFFLIGKYGIRVGDRIQIGAVVGEVIDLGLVRMHLMELNADGPLGPTGRVVAFANLIVFQASGGLFKQIPGVNLAWHETKLSLPAVDDYAALKEALLAAVNGVVGEYGEEIARQTREIGRSTASLSVKDATPQVQMHLVEGHMEALIRYPVNLKHAGEIEERVSAALLKVITSHPSTAPGHAPG
jgi:small-conductance mechanosensitive channel